MTAATEKTYLVLTAVGPDRPGLVSEIASAVHGAGANLEDSRMAILGGEFALLVLVSGTETAATALEQASGSLGDRLGLRVLSKRTGRGTQKHYLPYRISVTGFDRPGIVLRVSEILARRGVNVASLESRLSYAPLSGTAMFVLEAELQVPSEVALADLRRELEAQCDEENLDLSLESVRNG
ncbi:MAG TPA: ACT domain-containing protein [Polyangiaceae bacterium]|nr:ACT domain-containing protein [Polyangiaceae bacterium]